MLKTICYTSTVKPELKILDIEILFQETQRLNIKNDIYGVLVKKNDVFFQILEGEAELLDGLYAKIQRDKRHKNIVELLNNPVSELSFKNFNTEHAVIQDSNSLFELHDYISKLQFAQAHNSALFLEIIESLLDWVE